MPPRRERGIDIYLTLSRPIDPPVALAVKDDEAYNKLAKVYLGSLIINI
jgi:hypothetical protein